MLHKDKEVRIRFAPSPTGQLHVGSLRTALYNYLPAKKLGGSYILRIEDTDRNRFVPGALENLIHILDEMGVHHDEGLFFDNDTLTQKGNNGPYIQSQRLPIYKKYVAELLEKGKAYYCFCSMTRLTTLREEQTQKKMAPKYDKYCLSLSHEEIEERLTSNESYVIRLNVDENYGEVIFNDLIRGQVSIHSKDVDDQVLMKSDGFPTYHLANVVDDHLMRISHVIRGEEWLSSTPKHILLYEAFGWELPQFAHLPLLLNPDKSKLSKRQGDVSVEAYLEKGYLKEALINFVALLGWNPGSGNTQEIFTLDELVQQFDISKIHKAGAVFDIKKLDWMNAEYIKKLTLDELYEKAVPFLTQKELFQKWQMCHQEYTQNERDNFIKRVLEIEQDRLTKLSDVGDHNLFFFTETLTYDTALLHWKKNTGVETKSALERALTFFTSFTDNEWNNRKALEEKCMNEADEYARILGGAEAGKGRGDFLWPVRVALTGAERSPSPFDVAFVIGKEQSIQRLTSAFEKLN